LKMMSDVCMERSDRFLFPYERSAKGWTESPRFGRRRKGKENLNTTKLFTIILR
jgi:hypothetical protein